MTTKRKTKWLLTPSTILCALLAFVAGGTDIRLTATPTTLQPAVTSSLSVKCSLSDVTTPRPATTPTISTTSTSGSSLVGRAAPDYAGNNLREAQIPNTFLEVPKNIQDVTSTTNNNHLREAAASRNRRAETEAAASSSSAAAVADEEEKIRQVISISISRDSQLLATVTSYTDARPEAGGVGGVGNVKVTGDVSGQQAGEMGFLSMDWQYPTSNETGTYSCSISAITEEGHSLHYTGTVDVKADDVSLGDMVKEMGDVKKLLSDQKATISTLEAKLADQKSTIDDQQVKINTLTSNHVLHNDSLAAIKARQDTQQLSLFDFQTQLSDHKTELSDHQHQLSDHQHQLSDHQHQLTDHQTQLAGLHKDVTEALHIETGVLSCGNSGSWTTGSITGVRYDKYKVMSQQFKTAYSAPPTVFLSIRFMNPYYGSSTSIRGIYGLSLKNSTQTGFEMFCESHSSAGVRYLDVSWLSIANRAV